MSGSGGYLGEAQQLRERFARFRDAALRINESLDLDVVLQGVLDSARELTGGEYALISLVNGGGELQACLTSGLTAEQSYGFLHEMPDRWEIYEFLIGVEAPIRVGDFQGYLAERGLPEFSPPFPVSEAMAYLAVPIRYSGERSGVIYVTEKEQGFTAEDEETLAVFASLAAVVISNARRFESERRARADLEGLVGTAPMSVVVFDAETGAVRSMNREARRLMGELGASFGSAEELVGQFTYRVAGGKEEVFDGQALEEVLRSGEAIRDLEVTAGFPHGRSVELIVNAAPITGTENHVPPVRRRVHQVWS